MRDRLTLTMTPSDSASVPLRISWGRRTLNDGGLHVSEKPRTSSCSLDSTRDGPNARAATAARTARRFSMLEAPIVEHVGQQMGLVVVPEERHVVHDGRGQEDGFGDRRNLELDEVLELRRILDRRSAARGVRDG